MHQSDAVIQNEVTSLIFPGALVEARCMLRSWESFKDGKLIRGTGGYLFPAGAVAMVVSMWVTDKKCRLVMITKDGTTVMFSHHVVHVLNNWSVIA